MKPVYFIAPVLSLAGSAYWLNQQETTLTELEEKTTVLQGRITDVKSLASADPSGPGGGTSKSKSPLARFMLPDGTLDWKQIAEFSSRNNNGMPTDMKTMMQIQAAIMEMSTDDLIKNISLIRSLDIPSATSKQLQSSLFQILTEKDPVIALKLIEESSEKDGTNTNDWVRRRAFSKLASTDPAAAIKWLDERIAKGEFRSKALDPGDNPLLQYESSLISKMLGSDPSGAKARLAQYSTAEKKALFRDEYVWRIKGKLPEAYAELVRENLPPEDALSTIGNAYGSVRGGKLEDLDKTLEEINFTEEERNAVIKKGFNHAILNEGQNQESLDKAYLWAKEKLPEAASAMATKALVQRTYRGASNFAETFQSALTMAEANQSPEIAIEFVNATTKGQPDRAEGYLGQIEDPDLKEKFQVLYDAIPREDSPAESE